MSVQQLDGGEYLVAEVRQPGKTTAEVLPGMLNSLIASLRFDKTMRWNNTNTAFSRPIRWLLAILDGNVLPVEFAGLQAGNITRGLRFSQHEMTVCTSAAQYFSFLEEEGILADPIRRRAAIAEQVRSLARSCDADETVDENLLDEVTNLVEAPTALLGKFDEETLSLPSEVLVGVMKNISVTSHCTQKMAT